MKPEGSLRHSHERVCALLRSEGSGGGEAGVGEGDEVVAARVDEAEPGAGGEGHHADAAADGDAAEFDRSVAEET